MVLDPKYTIDFNILSREMDQDRLLFVNEVASLMYESLNQPISIFRATGGENVINVGPEDYKITDAPKELAEVCNVNATGSGKKY